MSYMKRLLESLETVPTDSIMHELLDHSCPSDVYTDPVFGEVKVMKITLHCAVFVIKCIYINGQYIIISKEETKL